VGPGAVRTDNEGRTLAGMGGSWRWVDGVWRQLAAGGSPRAWEGGGGRGGDAEEEGNKDLQQNAADKSKRKHSSQLINGHTGQLVRFMLYVCVCVCLFVAVTSYT